MQNEKYSVFISFKRNDLDGGGKTRDCELAEHLHKTLQVNGITAFFSEKDLLTSRFRRQIDDALDQAQILVVVGTKCENMEAEWVKYEWETFQNDIWEKLKPHGEIITYLEGMSPKEAPRGLRTLQSFKSNEIKELVKFIKKILGMYTGTEIIIPPYQSEIEEEARIKEQKRLEEEDRQRQAQLKLEEEQRQQQAQLKLQEEQRQRQAQLKLQEEQRQRQAQLKLEEERRRYKELKKQSVKNFLNKNKTSFVSVAVALILISSIVIVLCQSKDKINYKSAASETYGEARDVTLTLTSTYEYDDESLLYEMCSYFSKKYTEENDDVNSVTINIVMGNYNYIDLLDIDSMGDVFCTHYQSTKSLADNQAIYPITTSSDDVINLVGQPMANTTFYNGNYYGYPYAPDTAQIMYYNTSLYTEDDVKSLNVMLEKSFGNIKNLAMNSSSWNTSTWYFTTNAKLFTGGNKDICTFDSAECVEALKFVQANNSNILISNSIDIVTCMKDGMIAAALDGFWAANKYKTALGENFGVEMLPKVTINGRTYQMTCFGGCEYYAVNATSNEPEVAFALAQYLASEEVQLKRYEINGTVPTALALLDNDVIKSDPLTYACMKQGEYIVPHEVLPLDWWTDSENLFQEIYSGTIKSEDIQSELTKHVESWKQM
ncbi:MAG: extracellular solute-binding protein [Firmicutes bacterium]|nr:extracellular solute-binding protein [Bacillota bacterium]